MLCREGQGKASSCCVAPPEHPLQLLLAVWDRTARAQCSPSARANTSPDPRRTPPRAVCQLGFSPHSMGWSQPGGPCPPFQHRDWDLPFQQGRWHPARTATFGHTALRILPLSLNSPRSSAAHACWRASPPRAFQAIPWGWGLAAAGFQHRVRVPPIATLCRPLVCRHGMAPTAKPWPHVRAGLGWVNFFPVTSRWPLVLWKNKPSGNHISLIAV